MATSDRKYYFLAIADELNITKASANLYISQPSLTQHLNKLEEELGVKLVDRKYQPLRLTRFGEIYADYLKKSKALEEQMLGKIRAERERDKESLRIGIPIQMSELLTRKVISPFMHKYPDIQLNIWEGTSITAMEELVKGNLDIAMVHHNTLDSDKVEMAELYDDYTPIICNISNPIVKGKIATREHPYEPEPSIMSGQLFYQLSPKFYLYQFAEASLRKNGIKPTRRIVLSSLVSIANCIVESPDSGFAYISDWFLSEYSNKDKLAFLRFGGNDMYLRFVIMKGKGRRISAEARLFWDNTIEIYKNR